MPIRMNTKFVEIVVLKPGRRIFIAEATIASAKEQDEVPEVFQVLSRGRDNEYGRGKCGDHRDVGLG
jgi:hypothetical protein